VIDQATLDKEIKLARLEYDIAAYRAKLLDEKRKLLENQLTVFRISEAIAEFEQKILSKEAEKSQI
jgi:hypothetical protein